MYSITSTKNINEQFNPNRPEGKNFYLLYNTAENKQFEMAFLEVKEHDVLICILPYFVMDFPLNTMLPNGLIKKSINWLKIKIVFVGHPSCDHGYIHGDVSLNLLKQVNSKLRSYASLICYKGFGTNLPLLDFTRVKGLPIAILNVSPTYWETLKGTVRKNLRKRLTLTKNLKFLETNGLPLKYVDQVHSLYENTQNRSNTKFEFLHKNYFINTSSISKYLFYFDENEIIGFVQLLCSKESMSLKYGGMDYKKSLKYQVYFAMQLQGLNICIRDGIKELDFGVTSYQFKNYMGALNYPLFNYFHHSNYLVNWLLKKISFIVEPSRDELK